MRAIPIHAKAYEIVSKMAKIYLREANHLKLKNHKRDASFCIFGPISYSYDFIGFLHNYVISCIISEQ